MSLLFQSLWSYSPALWAVQPYQNPADEAASGAAGLLCCGIFVGLPLLIIAANIAILFWVAKDAKSRGMDGAMWLFLIFFTGVIGLAIYLFSRPQGQLTQCHNCGNNRMEASIKCPHCGAGQGRRPVDDEEDEEDRPTSKRTATTQGPAASSGLVVACPYCGVRLRFPRQSSGLGQRYTCPKCHRTVELDKTV